MNASIHRKPNRLNPRNLRIVLVLQGGGALGAYQAGVYQALHEHDLVPDWIVGTSIGAINGALIAGNEKANRLQRVRQFWNRMARPDSVDMLRVTDRERRSNSRLIVFDAIMRGIPGFFLPRLFSGFAVGMRVPPDQASFYDTTALAGTLEELVDFDYLNSAGGMRLTINAVKVKSGELAHFDSRGGQLSIDHVRASGALPPAFPPIRVNGELYWDGGLYSNTPLESVLHDLGADDTLCFMVDLWSAQGTEPATLDEVQTRQKDVVYASRSKRHIEDYVTMHRFQRALRELYQRLPATDRTAEDERELARLGCDSTLHIVRLPYRGTDWHMPFKDVNFSRGSIAWRWAQGYQDAMSAIGNAAWLKFVTEPAAVVVHELPAHASDRRHAR